MKLRYRYIFKKNNRKKIIKKINSSLLNVKAINLTNAQLINLNAFLGSKHNEWNDLISFFFLGIRHKFIILNLEYSKIQIRTSLNLLFNVSSLSRSLIFIVGNFYKQQILLKRLYKKLRHTYYNAPWIAGSLSNFKKFRSFFYKKANKKYVQKKVIMLMRKRQKYLKKITNMFKFRRVPNLIFNISITSLVIDEAKRFKIPTISLYDGNSTLIKKVDYPILINDSSVYNLSLYARLIKYSIILGKVKFLKKLFSFYKNFKYFSRILINFLKKKLLSVAGFEPALRRSKF